MPRPVLALPWGSASMISTRLPQAASAVAKFTAVVVLPTPPFWLASAMIRAGGGGDWVALAATVTLDLRQSQDGPRRVGSAGESLHPHPPCFGCLGQFLVDPNALVKQGDRAGMEEWLRELEQDIERCHRAGGDEVGGKRRHRLEATIVDHNVAAERQPGDPRGLAQEGAFARVN